jgi:hypothetical protein
MPEPLRILAGDCIVIDEDADETRRERGNTVTICKPDNCGELLAIPHGVAESFGSPTPDLSSGRPFPVV